MRLAPLFHAALCLVLFTIACGPTPSTQETPTADKPTHAAVAQRTLKIGLRRGPDILNPYISSSETGNTINHLLFPSLFHELPTLKNSVPQLDPYLVAEHRRLEAPANTYELKLHSGLTWSDGAPLTTADVAYTLEIQQRDDLPWFGFIQKDLVASYTVIDDTTLTITFSNDSLYNLVVLNEGLIVPKHHFSKVPVAMWSQYDWQMDQVVYGPYRVTNLTDEHMTLAARDPATPIQEVSAVFIRQRETLHTLLKSGDLDYTWSLPQEHLADITEGLQPAFYQDLFVSWIAWNPLHPDAYSDNPPKTRADLTRLKETKPHPVLGDARVRRALTLALDRTKYLERLWHGHAHLPASPWRAGLGYLDHQAAPDDGVNLTEAAELLQAAGWGKTDGHWHKGDQPLRLSLLCLQGSDLRNNYLQLIQADLARFGVDVQLKVVEASQYLGEAQSRHFDGVLFAVRLSSRPIFASLFHGDAAVDGDNWSSTTELDDLIEKLKVVGHPEELQTLLVEIEQRYRELMPVTLLFNGRRLAAFRPGLQFEAHPSHLSPLYRLETWRLQSPAPAP